MAETLTPCARCNGSGSEPVPPQAIDPRDFGLTAADLRSVAERLYDCADSRLDLMDDVSVRFGQIRSRLRGLADALDQEAQP